jgi:hypothetical protein
MLVFAWLLWRWLRPRPGELAALAQAFRPPPAPQPIVVVIAIKVVVEGEKNPWPVRETPRHKP